MTVSQAEAIGNDHLHGSLPDESVVYSMNFQVVCEPREFIRYDIQYNSDITFCLREFKVTCNTLSWMAMDRLTPFSSYWASPICSIYR